MKSLRVTITGVGATGSIPAPSQTPANIVSRRSKSPRAGQSQASELANSVQASTSRVLLVASSGGHLLQLQQLASLWEPAERTWVTFPRSDAESMLVGESITWAYYPTNRHLLNALRNLKLAWTTIRRTRPTVVVTTGAGVAVPFALIAWLAGINVIYIESMARVLTPSLTGRLIYPIATHFFVQWPDLVKFFPRAIYHGTVIDFS
jgi:beta-1,4-N-acetylglucosaminyltransferase